MESPNIGKELLEKLQDIKNEKGKIDSNDLNDLLNYCITIIKCHITNTKEISLYNEIKELSEEIGRAKKEFSEINKTNSTSLSEYHILDATLELLEVTKETESATNIILDKCDEIMTLLSQIENQYVVNKLTDIITIIMQACNFQDLTGQRINKVIKKLDELDEKLNLLLKAVGAHIDRKSAQNDKKEEFSKGQNNNKKDANLINGPQRNASAPTQSQIDDLFDNI